MSDARHTPGKWEAGEGDGEDGTRWCVTAAGWLIATVENGSPDDTLETEAANARLIAAAPDLLAACEALLAADELDPRTWPSLCAASIATADAHAQARAALALARGGA